MSAKFLLGGWLITTTALLKLYSGNLKSNLALSKSIRINTLEDLFQSSGTRAVARFRSEWLRSVKRASLKNNVKDMKDNHNLKKLYGITSKWENENLGVLDLFPNGTNKYAIFENTDELNDILTGSIEKTRAYFQSSGTKIYVGKTDYCWSMFCLRFSKKRLPKRILEYVDLLITRYVETAQYQRGSRVNEHKSSAFMMTETETTMNVAKAMTIDELIIIFRVWFVGTTIALLVLFRETMTVKRLRKTSKISQQPFFDQ